MDKEKRYGAYPEDWEHLVSLGLTEDLLPVVSNPNARVSPTSTMKRLGKTPSKYNGKGHVVGIPKWTDHKAMADDIKEWMKEPDYGICIQTRRLRALDVDVEDIDKAQKILEFIKKSFAQIGDPPIRYRKGSGKLLVPVFMEGNFHKRTLKVDGGMIEFLASGQQFVAYGTHPSGARYEWCKKIPITLQ